MKMKWMAGVLLATMTLSNMEARAQLPAPVPVQPVNQPAAEENLLPDPQMLAQGLIGLSLVSVAIALCFAAHQYNRNQNWHRLEFLRKTVREFENDPEIWKALQILDFEEYRDYEINPAGKTIVFRTSNELLCAALGSHDERLKRKQEIDEQSRNGTLDPKTLERYQIETTLRDWFNKMLNGLEHFGYLVDSGMFTANAMRPWMIYWIRLIADREYKRPGASKFYDQLYCYIHDYGFFGVIRLFERFGYRLLPTPYRENDFVTLGKELPAFNVQAALSLAKASQLIYEDITYVTEITQRWGISIKGDFRYFNNKARDTQAFMFRTNEFIVLAFRGSQEFKDWQTNFSTRLRKVSIRSKMQPLEEDWVPPRGQVHRGFQAAWESVETSVLRQLQQWNQKTAKPLPLYITGHSLGGALATVAAASLVKRKFNVQGLYTFGQPRAGDLVFATELNTDLEGKVFRFVNNNDIVPHVPPPYLPWNPFRIYKHAGQMLYFDWRGNLISHPNPIVRFVDLTIGLIRDTLEPGFDMINDHRMEFYISNLRKSVELEQERIRLMKEES